MCYFKFKHVKRFSVTHNHVEIVEQLLNILNIVNQFNHTNVISKTNETPVDCNYMRGGTRARAVELPVEKFAWPRQQQR